MRVPLCVELRSGSGLHPPHRCGERGHRQCGHILRIRVAVFAPVHPRACGERARFGQVIATQNCCHAGAAQPV